MNIFYTGLFVYAVVAFVLLPGWAIWTGLSLKRGTVRHEDTSI